MAHNAPAAALASPKPEARTMEAPQQASHLGDASAVKGALAQQLSTSQ